LRVVAAAPDRQAVAKDGLDSAGDELWRISARAGLLSDGNYGDIVAQLNASVQSVTRGHAGVDHVIVGTAPLFHEAQTAVLKSLTKTFVLASVLIAMMLVWMLRTPVGALLAMLPNALPIAFVFGVASWRGARIDVGTMITAIVGLGIAVNGTLHLLTWFCDGLRRGRSRRRAMLEAVVRCGPALWQSSISVSLGLLVLTSSELPLISRFAGMMAALIGSALAAHLVLLPALLAGPLGSVLQRSIPRQGDDEHDRTETIAPPHIRFRRVSAEVSRPAI
jgi:predicted RND superfamily exporter protein